jgi:hypothetical protein
MAAVIGGKKLSLTTERRHEHTEEVNCFDDHVLSIRIYLRKQLGYLC